MGKEASLNSPEPVRIGGTAPSGPLLPITVFVVSLARAVERWARIEKSLLALGQPYERVNALDAAADRDLILAARGLETANDGEHPFQIEPRLVGEQNLAVSEEACFLSHLSALRAFLRSGQRFGLILEDDAGLTPGLFAPDGPFAHCISASEHWEIVKVEGTKQHRDRLGFVYSQCGEGRIIASLMPSSGAAAYLVSRSGAQQLIRHGIRTVEPWDTFLVDVGRHRARLLDYSPYPIHQTEEPSYNLVVPKGRTLKARLGRSLPKLRRHFTRLALLSVRGVLNGKPLRKCRWRQ